MFQMAWVFLPTYTLSLMDSHSFKANLRGLPGSACLAIKMKLDNLISLSLDYELIFTGPDAFHTILLQALNPQPLY